MDTNKSKSKVVPFAVAVAFGALVAGLNLGGISGAIGIIGEEFGLDALMTGLVTGSLMVGCLLGALTGGRLSDVFGRKAVIMASLVLLAASAAGCGILSGGAVALIVFRLIGGLGVGALSAVIPTYISEISTAKWRGTLVSLYQVFIVIGILLAYTANYFIAPLEGNWHYMLGFPAIFALISMILLAVSPESPRWLAITGRNDAAEKAASRLRVEEGEKAAMLSSVTPQKESVAFGELFKGITGKIVFLGCMLAFFQQITGINVVINYAPGILSNLGIAAGDSLLQTVLIGVANLVFTLIALWLCDKFPRKSLLISGSIGSALSLGYLAYAFSTASPNQTASLIAIIAFIAFFALSLSPLMFVVSAEIYPSRVRGTAMALSTGISWACAFLVVQLYPWMESTIGAGAAFGIFSGLLLAAALFIWVLIPETKDKSLEEIEEYFYGKK